MRFQIAQGLLVVVVTLRFAATTSAFHNTAALRRYDTTSSSSTTKQRIMMVAAPLSNNEEHSDLSSLVSGMLQSHRESVDVEDLVTTSDTGRMPQASDNGIYTIRTKEQYENFLIENADKLVVLKFSSPFCQACRKLKQKFRQYSQDENFKEVVFGDISVNKNLKKMNDDASSFFHFVTAQLNVTRIPYIHFYGECTGEDCRLVDSFAYNDRLVDSFACDVEDGCSWQTLKEKMTNFATMKLQDQQQQQPQKRPTIKKRILNFFNSKTQ